jgi:hypothetical protein
VFSQVDFELRSLERPDAGAASTAYPRDILPYFSRIAQYATFFRKEGENTALTIRGYGAQMACTVRNKGKGL